MTDENRQKADVLDTRKTVRREGLGKASAVRKILFRADTPAEQIVETLKNLRDEE